METTLSPLGSEPPLPSSLDGVEGDPQTATARKALRWSPAESVRLISGRFRRGSGGSSGSKGGHQPLDDSTALQQQQHPPRGSILRQSKLSSLQLQSPPGEGGHERSTVAGGSASGVGGGSDNIGQQPMSWATWICTVCGRLADRNQNDFQDETVARRDGASSSIFSTNSFRSRRDLSGGGQNRSDHPSRAISFTGFRRSSTGGRSALSGGTILERGQEGVSESTHERRKGNSAQCLKSLLCSPFRPSSESVDRMKSIVRSKPWSFIILFFTILLLFGSQIQELWCPKSSDVAFDVLFTMAFVFLLADIVLRGYIQPTYFLWQFHGQDFRKDASPGGGERPSHKSSDGCLCFKIGSFMFWCDLISTMTLLYDISYINTGAFDINTIDILLNESNIPIEGMDQVNNSGVVELPGNIIVAIGRTARVARFIRASAVVKTSSKVNWYWIPQHLNPFFYFDKCFNMDGSKVVTISKETETMAANTNATGINGNGDPSNKQNRRRSFTTGGASATRSATTPSSHYISASMNSSGNGSAFRSVLGAIGYRRENKEARRNDAAIKIQRAWRRSIGSHSLRSTEARAWDGGPSARRASSVDSNAGSDRGKRGSGSGDGSNKKSSIVAASSIIPAMKQSLLGSSSNQSSSSRRRSESQVGSAMRELTGQRVALGIMVALVLTVIFTYTENDSTQPATMIVLHNQTQNRNFAGLAIDASRASSVPDLYQYTFVNGAVKDYALPDGEDPADLRDREKLQITVTDAVANTTSGMFSVRDEQRDEALVELVITIFILLIWFFGVTAFAGPVMTLVVIPIERMIRLLTMLMRDPLGYQSTPRYKKFAAEEDEFTRNTRWTKDVLKGMETSFLMSTILRIGSLMKVGFGSAGVEIIRNNLEKGQKKDTLFLNSQGSTVSCIFLFCDIRQFTDATECLQEEVFVFTNKIAAVVHSICHSYGGSANKNVGDAFLLSWQLDQRGGPRGGAERDNSFMEPFSGGGSLLQRRVSPVNGFASGDGNQLVARHNQADKALLSVVKICIALQYDKYYLESMSETARDNLLKKLSKRKGPVVQMGFGLHAGEAVQGAIGSQRKLDATYVSESVELAEFLESSTKKYGLKMLMSGAFHNLLQPSNRRRCRKIDQIVMHNKDDDDNSDTGGMIEDGDIMELFTFDMDIDALWKVVPPASSHKGHSSNSDAADNASDSESNPSSRPPFASSESQKGSWKDALKPKDSKMKITRRRVSVNARAAFGMNKGLSTSSHHPTNDATSPDAANEANPSNAATGTSDEGAAGGGQGPAGSSAEGAEDGGAPVQLPDLILPTGPAIYNSTVWVNDDMRKIRQLYSDGLFFQKFNSGLQSYYARDWEHARQCFRTILERFEDGPSRYFLKIIEDNNGIPPRNFTGYGVA